MTVLGPEICDLFPEQRSPIPIFNPDLEDGIAVDPESLVDADGGQPALVYSTGAAETHAELIFLMLPSGLPKAILDELVNVQSPKYSPGFANMCKIKLQLRMGHANDILQDIRTAISRISFQWTKNYQAADRKMPKTRSRTAIDNLHKSVSHCRHVYNLCCSRMIALKIPDSVLEKSYQKITNEDVKASTVIREGTERGSTREKLSWIFQTEMEQRGDSDDQVYLREYLRIHWMRARHLQTGGGRSWNWWKTRCSGPGYVLRKNISTGRILVTVHIC